MCSEFIMICIFVYKFSHFVISQTWLARHFKLQKTGKLWRLDRLHPDGTWYIEESLYSNVLFTIYILFVSLSGSVVLKDCTVCNNTQ